MRYQPSDFPLRDPNEAKFVVSQIFDIRDYQQALYVNLDAIRSDLFWQDVLAFLGIRDGALPKNPPPHYNPILFFGHRGAGKSVELWRLKEYLQQPGLFDVVYMDSDSEFNYGQFRWEDFFLLMMNAINRKADPEDKKLFGGLRDMAKMWLGVSDIVEEVSRAQSGSGAVAKDENWLLESMGDRETFKKVYSENTSTARQIRLTINNNPPAVASAISDMVDLLRKKAQGKGFRDVLFIFDGTEKIDFSQYEKLFLNNVAAMQGLGSRLICGVPIAARHKLQGSLTRNLYDDVMLPMYHLEGDDHYQLFGEIITKRVDKDVFLEDEALKHLVRKSGGSPRQLLQVFEKSLFRSRGAKVTLDIAQRATTELGKKTWEDLSPQEIALLQRVKQGDNRWERTDTHLELLDELVLMKYNGSVAVNPLLDEFLLP